MPRKAPESSGGDYGVEKRRSGPGAGGLQVIGAGMSRCGTSSLTTALEHLGFEPTFHMAKAWKDTAVQRLVVATFDEEDKARRQKLISQWLSGSVAVTDVPALNFLDDLMDMYPDARVVLNTRSSAEAWAASVANTIALQDTWAAWLSSQLVTRWRLHERIHLASLARFRRQYGIRTREGWPPELYHAHNAWVRAETARRGMVLLEWQPQDGWRPLCDFLGVPRPPPDVPFPWVNDTAQRRRHVQRRIRRGLALWGLLLSGVLLAGWVVVLYFSRHKSG